MSDERIPASVPLDDWLARLAQPTGVPGGGAASGVMLAVGAGLLRMVAEYTQDADASTAAERLSALRSDALQAAEDDGAVSGALGDALRGDRHEHGRDARVRRAALDGARSSVALGTVGLRMLPELALLQRIGNPHVEADLGVAAEALGSGVGGALINLRANLALAGAHREHDDGADADLARLEADAAELADAHRRARAAADAVARAAS